MTATEWDQSDDVDKMLVAVRGRVSERKLLLFACGCCRLVEATIPTASFLADRFERDSERPLTTDEKWSMFSLIGSAMLGDLHPIISRVLSGFENDSWNLARNVASLLRNLTAAGPEPMEGNETHLLERPAPATQSPEQAALLRELVANPMRESDAGRWRTETTIGISQGIETDGAWERMPILADALEDAGCEDNTILDHCRDSSRVHRKGCWVVDEILGRP